MSLSPLYSFQSRFVTYLLNRPHKIQDFSNENVNMIMACIHISRMLFL